MNAAYCEVKIIHNKQISNDIFVMKATWKSDMPAPKCGQFYMLRTWPIADAPFLSRPISVNSFENNEISFMYELRGTGTKKLANAQVGDVLCLTGPSGNGFELANLKGRIALVGGGIGTAPLYYLAKELLKNGVKPSCFFGFRNAPYGIQELEKSDININIATDSGSAGHKGFITDIFKPSDYDVVCVCGPELMMEKVARMCIESGVKVYVSRENKMACGVGACLGCTCKTANKSKSVCKDGPVFEGSEIYA